MEEPRKRALTPLANQRRPTLVEAEIGMFMGGYTCIDVKKTFKNKKKLKNVKNVTKIKKTFVNVIKNVNSS